MDDLVLKNGYVVTVNDRRDVFDGGWVSVRGKTISGVGSALDPLPPAHRVVDLDGKIVIPGLINGHNHHWASLFKNTGEGLLLEDWLDAVTLPLKDQLTPGDLESAGYLSAIEQIRTGTTCSVNHLNNENDEANLEAIIRPSVVTGTRTVVMKELRGSPKKSFGSDTRSHKYARTVDEDIALARETVAKWHGYDDHIHIGLAIEAGAMWLIHNTTSEEVIYGGLSLAEELDIKVTNHCGAGTQWLSIKELRDLTGGGDIDYLSRLGALSDRWVMAHCIWVSPREIDLMATNGITVVTNPVSNAYSADGIAPLKEMIGAGIPVGIGSDGAYVNCSVDMLQQMKFGALIHNVTHLNPALFNAERMIEMATIEGARAIGLDHLIGSLEAGKLADIAVFDLSRAPNTVANRPVSALVFTATGADASMVLVNGRVLLEDGQLRQFDNEQDVLDDARARARRMIDSAGISHLLEPAWRPAMPRIGERRHKG